MRVKLKKFVSPPTLAIALAFFVAGLGLSSVKGAGSASLTLSPSSGSVQNGNNITLSIYENSGAEAVNAVQADLSYDTSKLQYVSADISGSPFNVGVSPSGGGGSVSFSRGLIGSTTGSQLVGRVTFKAIAGSGSAAVTFGGGSAIVRLSDSQNIWNGSTSGGSYSLTSPATPPPAPSPSPTPSPSPSPSPSPTPSPTPTPTPTPSPTPSPTPEPTPTPTPPPAAFQLTAEASRIGFTQAKVVVSTSTPASVQILYGLKGSLSFSTEAKMVTGSASIALDSKLLGPGLVYDYQAKATDSAGNVVTTETKSFTTRGFKLRLWLKDKNGNPFKRHKVELHSQVREAETDDDGYVTFEDVAPGQHEVKIQNGGEVLSQEVVIEDNRTAADQQLDQAVAGDESVGDLPAALTVANQVALQDFALTIPTTLATQSSSSRSAILLISGLAAVIVVLVGLLLTYKRRGPGMGIHQGPSAGIGATVVGGSSTTPQAPPSTPSEVIHPDPNRPQPPQD